DTPTPALTTLSLHDALPISPHHDVAVLDVGPEQAVGVAVPPGDEVVDLARHGVGRRLAPAHRPSHHSLPSPTRRWIAASGIPTQDRKSTRLNSSHVSISYAV